MQERLDKQQLISLVEQVMRGEGKHRQLLEWGHLMDQSTPGPRGYALDLIFYPEKHGLGSAPTAEEIVEKALSYKPIQL